MVALPEILYKEEYKDEWDFDELEPWKPKAKPGAPKVVKEAIEAWVAEMEEEDDGDAITML